MRRSAALSPTTRSTIVRHHDRAQADRAALFDVLRSAAVCHLGVVRDGYPLVVPTIFGADRDGPDEGGSLYVHGSVAARSLADSPGTQLCVTVTVVDGLVLARSAFHHSMNYRSAVILGTGRLVDGDEKRRALALIVDHVVPGRSATLRDHSRKEMAATSVIAVPLQEASVKQREGPPVDDPSDVEAGVWAGVVPIRTVAGEAVTADDADGQPVPANVAARVQSLR